MKDYIGIIRMKYQYKGSNKKYNLDRAFRIRATSEDNAIAKLEKIDGIIYKEQVIFQKAYVGNIYNDKFLGWELIVNELN